MIPVSDTTKLTFQCHIVYSRTFTEVEKATDELLKFLETKYKDGGRPVIGLDVEWKPTFKKGEVTKAAVLQICADATNCHVMHIIHSGFPQNLQERWVGSAGWIFKDHKVTIEALQDLSPLANQKFGEKHKMWGLSSLTEKLTCKQVPKPKKITLGNWEVISCRRNNLNMQPQMHMFLCSCLRLYPLHIRIFGLNGRHLAGVSKTGHHRNFLEEVVYPEVVPPGFDKSAATSAFL